MYSGIVNIYKEQGFTSHDVVAKLRGIYGQKKVGHTGTLDPMAEGVLIVCLGQATKLSDLILTSKKQYIATMKLGISTDTDDVTGNVIGEYKDEYLRSLAYMGSEESFKARVEEVASEFLGNSMQIPPMYSAIKVNGKKLYEYARAGQVIEREERPIEIYRLDILEANFKDLTVKFAVECSKGTYIRSLIRDMGDMLGTYATMSALLRDEVSGMNYKDGYRLDDLQKLKDLGKLEETVLPMDKLLSDVPKAEVKPSGLKLLTNGNRLKESDLDYAEESDVKNASFIRIYEGTELKALYSYDKNKNDFKVYKML